MDKDVLITRSYEGKCREKTDLQAAQKIQTAKAALFAMFNKTEVKRRA